jgi:hypothetical protein
MALSRIGDTKEFKTIAGNVETMPAMSIHSASLRVVGRPKYEFEVDHQAKTGVEKPTMNAGITIQANKAPVYRFSPIIKSGNIQTVLKNTPPKNSHQSCFPDGIWRGELSRKRWCSTITLSLV